MKILLVEDEKQLSEALTEILIKNKYNVDSVYDGQEGLEYGLLCTYDIIILDIMLPKLNGLQVLKQLRSNEISVPIILLTAKGQIEDIVVGLDCGADDYLTKPFAPEELLARLRALNRRNVTVINNNLLSFGDIRLNLSSYDIECNTNSIRLTLKEFEILQYFMQRPRMVVSKDDLISKLWGYDSDVEHNNIEVYISFLRKKLSHLESRVNITTLRGIGYRLEEKNV